MKFTQEKKLLVSISHSLHDHIFSFLSKITPPKQLDRYRASFLVLLERNNVITPLKESPSVVSNEIYFTHLFSSIYNLHKLSSGHLSVFVYIFPVFPSKVSPISRLDLSRSLNIIRKSGISFTLLKNGDQYAEHRTCIDKYCCLNTCPYSMSPPPFVQVHFECAHSTNWPNKLSQEI
jgi:hypothetical protein